MLPRIDQLKSLSPCCWVISCLQIKSIFVKFLHDTNWKCPRPDGSDMRCWLLITIATLTRLDPSNIRRPLWTRYIDLIGWAQQHLNRRLVQLEDVELLSASWLALLWAVHCDRRPARCCTSSVLNQRTGDLCAMRTLLQSARRSTHRPWDCVGTSLKRCYLSWLSPFLEPIRVTWAAWLSCCGTIRMQATVSSYHSREGDSYSTAVRQRLLIVQRG